MKPVIAFLALCVVSAWIPIACPSEPHGAADAAFPGWSAAPLPDGLAPRTPDAREARFAAGFPGAIGVFTDGSRTYVARWVRRPTRRLHPATDCLRASGYSVKPGPILAGAGGGGRWGVAHAQRGGERLRVREHIVAPDGREWTDVSAWFWHAALGRSNGPWWAITVFEPAS